MFRHKFFFRKTLVVCGVCKRLGKWSCLNILFYVPHTYSDAYFITHSNWVYVSLVLIHNLEAIML